MALLFIEGFEVYGSSAAELTDGAYLDSNQVQLDSSIKRTGSYALRAGDNQAAELRRALYGEYTTLGMGFGLYIDELPVESLTAQLCAFKNDDNSPQITVWLSTAGNIIVMRGGLDLLESGTELARTTDSAVITDAWQHFEIQVHFADGTDGWYEIRLDGVTVLQQSGIDTIATSTLKNVNQVEGIGTRDVYNGANTNFRLYMDDWYCYDMTGTRNNDWIGDRRVIALFPSDNGAVQQWTAAGASSAHDCIDDTSPDDDTTYIEAGNESFPVNSTFELDDVPSVVGAISGVQVYVKSKKTEAGEGNLQVSMISGSDEENGVDRPVSTIYAHRTDMFEFDPATGAPWSPSGLSAALVDVERTA